MHQIQQTYKIHASIEKVWEALTDPDVIEDWGGGPDVKMKAVPDFEFSLWGGDVYGKNTKMHAPSLLEQDWYGGKWDKPSKVVFKLSEEEGVTIVDLYHDDLPAGEVDNFADGWKDYYLGAIQELLDDEE